VKFQYKTGLYFAATLMAISSVASAADIAKGTYSVQGFTTASTCGSLSASLKAGTPTTATVVYPGAGGKMTLANPATASTGKAGSAASNVCVATTTVPSTGLNGANVTFNCYDDTVSGPASSAQAQLKSKFKVGASHSAAIEQVTVTSSVIVGSVSVCSFTTDGTYALE
jgi:hypothetical protein